jgi:hypothetical protein
MPEYRYFLTLGDGPQREVSMAEFVAVERAVGFHNTMGRPDLPATAGFGANGVHGSVMYVGPDSEEDGSDA